MSIIGLGSTRKNRRGIRLISDAFKWMSRHQLIRSKSWPLFTSRWLAVTHKVMAPLRTVCPSRQGETMFTIPEQLSAAVKTNYDAQLAMITALTRANYQSVAKMIDLNVNVAKTSLAESSAIAKQLLSAKSPQEWFTMTVSQAQPNAEKALAYGSNVAGIVAKTQAEFTKAVEEKMAETNRCVMALVDEVAKNVPGGSENAMALVKSAIGNTNAGYEVLTKTTQQAIGALEANLTTSTSEFLKVVEKAASSATAKS